MTRQERIDGSRLSSAASENLRGRFVFLDALRGIAAAAVVLFHFHDYWVSPIHFQFDAVLPRAVTFLLRQGDLGVEVFFVLSGFVIAHSLARHVVTPRFAGNFVVRRSIRLDPPYWVAIALALAWWGAGHEPRTDAWLTSAGGVRDLLVNMFYLPDLLWTRRIVDVAWTLCLEVQFYLTYLTLLWASQAVTRATLPARRRPSDPAIPAAWVLFALFAPLCAYSVVRWYAHFGNRVFDFGGQWFLFFTGALLYWTTAGWVRRAWWNVHLLVLLGLACWAGDRVVGAMLVSAVLIDLAARRQSLHTWLAAGWLQYLGRRSYSLYLVHVPVGLATIAWVTRHGGPSPRWAVVAYLCAVAASLGAADLMHRFVEAPSTRLSARLKPRPAAAPKMTQTPAVPEPELAVAAV